MTDLTLAEVMEQHPQLGRFGIGVFDPDHKPQNVLDAELAESRAALVQREATVHEVVGWLHANDLTPIQTPSAGSYTVKHLVEKDIGYVSNGEFIAAALMVGYPYRYRTPNVLFGISSRDLRRVAGPRG